MQTQTDRFFGNRSLSVPTGSGRRYFEAIFAFLLICQSAGADQKYITQPSRTPQQEKPAVGKAAAAQPPLSAQTTIPGPPRVRVSRAGKQSSESFDDSGRPLPKASVTSEETALRLPEPAQSGLSSQNNSYALPTVPTASGAGEQIGTAGINWVRRLPRKNTGSDGVTSEPLEFKALEFTLRPSTNPSDSHSHVGQGPNESRVALLPPEAFDSGDLATHSSRDADSTHSAERADDAWVESTYRQSETVSAQLTASAAIPNVPQEPSTNLASLVSQRIIGELDQQEHQPITQVGLTSGWASIGRQLVEHLRQSEHLAARGVFLSAREECQLALLLLVRYLDHLSNSFQCEPGLHRAQTALRESADFDNYLHTADENVLKQIVHSHQTPLLKYSQLKRVSPITLAEHYRKYAESEIVKASQNHPWFSDILYQMGRTYQAEADLTTGSASDHLRGQSLVYYRAAMAIVPANARAANQIGYILLQQDRPREAQQYLIASVDAQLAAPALQNLAEASRRLRDARMEVWAVNTLAAIHSGQGAVEPIPVQVLDTSTFAAISPASAGPKSAGQTGNPSASALNSGPGQGSALITR